ncbi:hypothetical protein LAZ67_20001001 [Cordylochernes scorpioides]|uniref:Uncharacterized protein n=1 Tax=Cordylochernes scorpioides TaxID=51811 RepID=A0ABY6LJM9_9ARAC|nr:hypothetical protein LAZ67_20001001 [Cordylochernes scorpioides]
MELRHMDLLLVSAKLNLRSLLRMEQTPCAAALNMEYKRCSSCIPGLGALTGYYQPGQLSPGFLLAYLSTLRNPLAELTAIGRVPTWRIGERPSDMKASCETSRITLTNKQSRTYSSIVRRGVDLFKNPDFN